MKDYSFDDLNWMTGYFAGKYNNPQTSDFYDVAMSFRLFYQLETYNLETCLNTLKERYQKSHWKVVLIPDSHKEGISKLMSLSSFTCKMMKNYPEIFTLYCPNNENVFQTNNLYSLYEPLIYHLDKSPLLMATNGTITRFIKVECRKDIIDLYESLMRHEIQEQRQTLDDMAYIIHLSDLHFGEKEKLENLNILFECLEEQLACLKSPYSIKIVITGDLMNSPRRKNMYTANDFMNILKKGYGADVDFVLGNHDVVVSGVNMFRMQKSKVVAYLLGESIRKLDDINVLFIKMNSSLHGNFARGMIGQRQLLEIDDELSSVTDLDNYTPMVLMHHHPVPVEKADFLKKRWTEKSIVGKMVEKSKALVDSKELISWLKKRNVHYVLHGHKHIPALNQIDDIYMIGAGSSTGVVRDDMDAYLSYNLLQYDVRKKKLVSCTLFYEDVTRIQPKHIYTRVFKEEI